MDDYEHRTTVTTDPDALFERHTLAQIKQNVENDADDAAPGAG